MTERKNLSQESETKESTDNKDDFFTDLENEKEVDAYFKDLK
jgi:hypothetical protein